MTAFQLLSAGVRMGLTGVLFTAVLSLLLLSMYQFIAASGRMRAFINLFVFAALLIPLAYFSAASEPYNQTLFIGIPWLCLPTVSGAVFVYSSLCFIHEYRKNKKTLSSASIRQAFDDVNLALCFADDKGRVVLLNHRMLELSQKMLGFNAVLLSQLTDALEAEQGCRHVSSGLYCFEDGSVWSVKKARLQAVELAGFTQLYFQNVTELYEANKQLEEENQLLKLTNEKTKRMYENLADRIREQETLKLKISVHDDIGSSLIAIREIMDGSATGSVNENLKTLKNAVSYFSANHASRPRSLEQTIEQARKMGVELVFEGELPRQEESAELILAACKECITNCVRHAGGNAVWARLRPRENGWNIRITNNGRKPKAALEEGGGLSSLRKRAEALGIKMSINTVPEFELELDYDKNTDS